MAETRLTNVVVPSVFTDYTLEPSIYRSRLWNAGIISINPEISGLLAGGGKTYNLPFWADVTGTSGDIPVEASAQTVNAVTANDQVFRKQFRTKAWGQNALALSQAGSSPLESAVARVNDYWAQAYEQIAIATLDGVVADDVANDSSSITNDISGGVGAAAIISDGAVIDAQAKLGENGAVRMDGIGDFAAIVVHPATYAYLRKQDLIDFVPISEQERPVEFYLGMRLIVTRNAPVDTGVYDTYLLKAGAMQYGVTSEGYEPTEVYREPGQGFGIDQFYTRRVFAIHPVGYEWLEGSVAGTSPTDAELATAANWSKVFNAEATGIVCLKHKLA
jgi:hypothetical protein